VGRVRAVLSRGGVGSGNPERPFSMRSRSMDYDTKSYLTDKGGWRMSVGLVFYRIMTTSTRLTCPISLKIYQ
jgi:hypothetical protein